MLPAKKQYGVKALLRELSDDEMDDNIAPIAPTDPQKPWLASFHLYLNTHDERGGMTIIEWWGVCILLVHCYYRSEVQAQRFVGQRIPLSNLGIFGR